MPLFRAWRRRVLRVLLPILAVALATATAALAATPPAGSVSSSNPQTTFTGQQSASNFLQPGDVGTSYGSPCPSQAMDSGDVVCGHYTLSTPEAGTVTVCVQFSPLVADPFGQTDLDVFVADTTPGSPTQGTVIASGTTQNNPECVTFTAVAGGTYEFLINPAFVFGPTNYTGTVTFQKAGPSGGAGGGGVGNPTGQKMNGGGKTIDGGQFNIVAFQSDPSKGKVKFQNGTCSVKSSSYSMITMSPTPRGGVLDADGSGQANGQSANFHVHAEDNGEPSSNDVFEIRATDPSTGAIICAGGGQVQTGNLQYHAS